MIYMLDTTGLSDVMREHPSFDARLRSLGPEDVVVTCTVAWGEVLFGIQRLPEGARRSTFEQKASRVKSRFHCMEIAPDVGEFYAATKTVCRRRGTSLGENDLWIAATARYLGATVVSRDADYRRVPGLAVEDWSR
ncbi:MAG: type II toxin-antitoxin system VapC family toxin [Phycisphaerales bacterium]|nr:MAG: type II toxin-antitoxin system VapC family toxin [Phycisphaerales bacterium]